MVEVAEATLLDLTELTGVELAAFEVEVAIAEVLVTLTLDATIEDEVVFTAATLVVVGVLSQPIPNPKKQKANGSATGTGAALATATNKAATGARAATRIFEDES